MSRLSTIDREWRDAVARVPANHLGGAWPNLADDCRRASRRRGLALVALLVLVAGAVAWAVAGFVAAALTATCLAATLPGSVS